MDIKDILNTPDTTAEYDTNDVAQNKVWAILSYIFVLFLLPLFVAKDSKFARYHASQGLTLFVAELAVGIVVTLVGLILGLIPVVGAILNWLIGTVTGLAALTLMVVGIINAAQGQAKELPFIGGIRFLK